MTVPASPFAGPILTQCASLDQVRASVVAGGYSALKVVTGWGAPGSGWDRASMSRAATMTKHLIVRTVAGDPSYDGGKCEHPIAQQVVQEIGPWYTIRPDLLIEIGNEPNIHPQWDDGFAWVYRWHLQETINACRAAFPAARLIAPALILDPLHRPRRWLEIVADKMRECHYIGVHAYEHDAFSPTEQRKGTTGQFTTLRDLHTRFFGDKPWILSEYGINDAETPAATKGRRYANLVRRGLPPQVVGALHYHLCFALDHQPQYHIAPSGDSAFRAEWDRLGGPR